METEANIVTQISWSRERFVGFNFLLYHRNFKNGNLGDFFSFLGRYFWYILDNEL